jgi:alkylation response protein AidB-like acyl-CoA dehydrogenase
LKKDKLSSTSPQDRLLKNEPFIKGLFCGRFLFDYLKYPEYDRTYKLNDLMSKYVEPVENHFSSASYENIIDKNGNFSADAFEKFKSLNLFSQSMPREYDGIGLDATGVSRMLEASAIYPSLGMQLIYNNEVAAKCILMYGSMEQKNKYLKQIASGELKACFCYSEMNNGVDELRFKTEAKLDIKEQVFILNGKKSWVSMLSNDEDNSYKDRKAVFIVFCKTNALIEEENDTLNAFLVESNTPGLTVKKQLTNFNGLNLYEIELQDVRISNEGLLGNMSSGHEISNKIVENSRHFVGSLCLGMLKDLFENTIKFIVDSRRFDCSLTEFQMIKDRVCDIERNIYVMESKEILTEIFLSS